MIYLFRWLFGFVSFSYKKGFIEDFLTDCFEQGIELRDIQSVDDYLIASCNLKSYKRLHKTARAHGGVTRIVKKRGLPFFLLPLKNRLGFLAGMVCFCAIISFLCSFVWSVELVGNNEVSDSVLYSYLENNNLTVGTMWSSVDRDKLAWNMLSDFDALSWVHINKVGTRAIVEVNEITSAPIPDNDKLQGRKVFRKKLSVSVSREQKNVVLKSTERYRSINFFSLKIPLYINRQKGEHSQKLEHMLIIKNTTLPIGYTEYIEQSFDYTTRFLDDRELKALAQRRMTFLENDELDGFEIVNKAQSYELDETKCVATFSYIVRNLS